MIVRRLFDAFALVAAIGVMIAHIFVVEMDERRFSWHPGGHMSIVMALLCVITLAYAASLLFVRRGRSRPALIAIVVAGLEMILLFWVPSPY